MSIRKSDHLCCRQAPFPGHAVCAGLSHTQEGDEDPFLPIPAAAAIEAKAFCGLPRLRLVQSFEKGDGSCIIRTWRCCPGASFSRGLPSQLAGRMTWHCQCGPLAAVWNTLFFPGLISHHLHTTSSGVCPGKIRWGKLFWKFPMGKLSQSALSWDFSLEVTSAKLARFSNREGDPRLGPPFPCG